MKDIGSKIRVMRKRAGLSQLDLETLMNASPGSISRLEAGKVNPSKETIFEIIEKLQLQGEEIVSLFEINPAKSKISDLWNIGNLKAISELNINPEKINYADLVIYLKAHLETGRFQTLAEMLEKIRARYRKTRIPQDLTFDIDLVALDLSIHQREFTKVKAQISEFNNLKSSLSRGAIGKLLLKEGKMHIYLEDIVMAEKSFKSSLEVLDKPTHYFEIIEVYLYLSLICLFNMNLTEAKDYLSRVDAMLSVNDNFYYRMLYYYRLACLNYCQEEFNLAKKHISESNRHSNLAGANAKDLHYNNDYLSRIQISEEDFYSAYKSADQSVQMENSLRGENMFSTSKLIKYYIEGKDSLQKSKTKLEELLSTGVRSNLITYVQSAMQYRFGEGQDRIDAEESLKRQYHQAPYLALKNAVTKTLHTGKLAVIL
jgi:transcriptional regulator with XRE-family HTH domain